jgi:hypothetical protein
MFKGSEVTSSLENPFQDAFIIGILKMIRVAAIDSVLIEVTGNFLEP